MLTFDDAKAIWIARWLKTPIKALVAQYNVDPRRLYEIWTEEAWQGSRVAAFNDFEQLDPISANRTDSGPHVPSRKVVKEERKPEEQLKLF